MLPAHSTTNWSWAHKTWWGAGTSLWGALTPRVHWPSTHCRIVIVDCKMGCRSHIAAAAAVTVAIAAAMAVAAAVAVAIAIAIAIATAVTVAIAIAIAIDLAPGEGKRSSTLVFDVETALLSPTKGGKRVKCDERILIGGTSTEVGVVVFEVKGLLAIAACGYIALKKESLKDKSSEEKSENAHFDKNIEVIAYICGMHRVFYGHAIHNLLHVTQAMESEYMSPILFPWCTLDEPVADTNAAFHLDVKRIHELGLAREALKSWRTLAG
ncbi:hypothetical protein Pelo_16058 [Pelomyxa schiedti]|nr:hypothetical protein Pelo_16058 [Pelomyxa schiedti]